MYFLEHQKENPDFLNEYLKYYCFIEFASTTTVNEKYFDLRTFFRYIKYKFHNQKFESIDEFKMFSIDDITLNDMNNVKPYIIDDFILEQRSDDMETMVNYINGNISLNDMKDHFTVFSPYWVKEYNDIKNITEDQKQFCINYIEFCEGMINYYPSDEPFSDVLDKLTNIYDRYGYTSDKVVQWEEENK